MRPDRAFLQDLKAMDPNLLVVWDASINRWQIREWNTPRHYERDARDRSLWLEKSTLVMTVCIRDEQFHDIGYKPLDQRTIFALKKSRRDSLDADDLAKEIDDHNERLERSGDDDYRLAVHDAGNYLNRYFHQPRVFIGG